MAEDQIKPFMAAVVGTLYGMALSFLLLTWQGKGNGDFTWMVEAARWLLKGMNPYVMIFNRGFFPYDSPFYYPVMAALVGLPFSILPPYLAGCGFFGFGSGLMAYAVARNRLGAWPAFLGVPFFMAASVAQWTPWLFAAALLPGLQFIAACKPNLGAALFIRKPSWKGWRSMAWITLLGFIVLPSWPVDWIRLILRQPQHVAPVMLWPVGPFLLLAFLKWKEEGGRLLGTMAIVPQFIWFYDQALLWLVPRSWQMGLVMAALSWVGYALSRMGSVSVSGAVMGWIYLPALLVFFFEKRLIKCQES